MKICLAQAKSIKGDIPANIENHLQFISKALAHEADAIFFPELSLTGYEPELAKALATTHHDARFAVFQQMSDDNGITIGAGMPIKAEKGIEITMLIFQPNQSIQTYAKQRLHEDELPYFTEGNQQMLLWPDNVKIAPAICYESLQASHAKTAYDLGARVYLASVTKSQNGINKAYAHYPAIAQQYQIPVLMVNCVGYCDNFESMGNSAVWNTKGELVAALDNSNEGILLFDLESEAYVKETC